ncbi:hypothetical protein N0V93_000495 [Gnomoniopsis smithogilvyi]|uniref:F-box domain-containing protein n=1 Tax=Gnomoniopsis smithogilvyi TaxID=1191159 RepID=A0A9W9D1T2_9PEZI|nr:hypothetical protein N0V93_000495 [Gnomoniopsis smithogilvyi]
MFVEGPQSQGFSSQQSHASADLNHKGFTPRSRQNSGIFNRDEHNLLVKGLHNGRRPPQRSRTTHENIPTGPQVLTLTMAPTQPRPRTPSSGRPVELTPAAAAKGREAQSASVPEVEQQQSERSDVVAALPPQRRRPQLGKPRRSYSVMDYEPVLPWQRPTYGALTFSSLPAEVHFAFFDFLDPIDATCLGLTNKHFYSIHRRLHGSVPLSVRRDGPNELEWAWHRAAYPTPSLAMTPCSADMGNKAASHLTALRVRGKGLCRKCGVSRCELHKHIVEWMPPNYEYCSVRDRFVPAPDAEAKKSCYMSNPTKTNRCGRHRVKRREDPPTEPIA